MSRRVLLIAATTGYQTRTFADAAREMKLDLVLATDRCHILENPWGDDAVAVRFEDPSAGIESLAAHGPFDGIVAVGDGPAFVAAQAAAKLNIPFSRPDAVLAAKNKFLARERFQREGLPTPGYRLVSVASDPAEVASVVQYPCVLKPLSLSASRGVIRANDAREFRAAFARIKHMIPGDSSLQVEDFIPGREFALEGLVTGGQLQVLALFDKPDPLDGPFFEETIYLTPSREPAGVRRSIAETTQRAISALGLTQGPIHAEMRVNGDGVWMLEVAARPIGGLCSRVLRFEPDMSLEEVVLRHALGEDMTGLRLAPGGHGVMMIPIPNPGVFAGAEGLEEAKAVRGVEEVVITAKEGQYLQALPEGASYLGFIFSRGASPAEADRSLREAHKCLRFQLSAALPVVK